MHDGIRRRSSLLLLPLLAISALASQVHAQDEALCEAVCRYLTNGQQERRLADDLRAAAPNGVNKTIRCECEGRTLTVKIVVKTNGQSTGSISGSQDLVIAIGGNASDPGSGNGGNANATNTGNGDAVAVAGDGGSGTNNGGDGGDATATCNGTGSSDAAGGNGGSGVGTGGDAGDADASSSFGGNASASGGKGGDPVNNPGAGGAGGNAGASTGSTGANGTGGSGSSGSGTNPGTHGLGATANAAPAGGSYTNGQSVPNV